MSEDLHAERREPEQPEGAFDLMAAATELLEQAHEMRSGRAARTLTPGAGAPLKQTLLALVAGRELGEHRTPGPATLVLLRGSATIGAEGEMLKLREGQWAAVPTGPHDLRADTDVVALLTVVATADDAG